MITNPASYGTSDKMDQVYLLDEPTRMVHDPVKVEGNLATYYYAKDVTIASYEMKFCIL